MDHKTSGLPIRRNPATVCLVIRRGLQALLLTDSNGSAGREGHAPPDSADTSGIDNADANNPTITYDTHSPDGDNLDTADITDANAFQVLAQGNGHLMLTNSCEIAADSAPDTLEDNGEQSIEFESNFSRASSVIVEVFPFGNPGAPIPGMPPERPSYAPFQHTQEDSKWAPFQSEHDWDVARWAKMYGTTSSAVDALFAIPAVCAAVKRYPCYVPNSGP